MAVSYYESHRPREADIVVSASPDFSGGFVCNGVADDVEIQAAMASLTAGRTWKERMVLKGSFNLAARLDVPAYTIIEGGSLFLNNGVNDDVIRIVGSHCEFRGIHIDGNKANNPTGNRGIGGDQYDDIIIEGCWIEKCFEMGIALSSGADNCVVRFNRITHDAYALEAGQDGIYIMGVNVVVEGNIIENVGDTGITVNRNNSWDGRRVQVKENIITNVGTGLWINRAVITEVCGNIINTTAGNGILIGESAELALEPEDLIISENTVINAGGHGIMAYFNGGIETSVNRWMVTDNIINNATTKGIYLYSREATGRDNRISDNIVWSCGDDGMYLRNIQDSEICGNVLNDNGNYGLYVVGVDNSIIKNNLMRGNAVGVLGGTPGTWCLIPEIFCRVTDPNGNIGTHPAVRLENDTDTNVYDQFYVPYDCQQLLTAHVVVVAAASGNMVWTVATNWGAMCTTEAYNESSDAANDTEGLLINDLECVDISATFTGIAAGDLVGVNFMRAGGDGSDTINDVVYYLGIRVRYV